MTFRNEASGNYRFVQVTIQTQKRTLDSAEAPRVFYMSCWLSSVFGKRNICVRAFEAGIFEHAYFKIACAFSGIFNVVDQIRCDFRQTAAEHWVAQALHEGNRSI